MKPGRKPINLVGQRFGRLTVDAPAPARRSGQVTRTAWWCLCDCGALVSVVTDSLRTGLTRSCGCLAKDAGARRRAVPKVGERFGRLVVEGPADPAASGCSRWLCRCDCGQVKPVRIDNLRKNGGTRACGDCRESRKGRGRLPVPVGERFCHLVVEGAVPVESGQSYWLCRCDCGRVEEIRASNLKNGNTKSCGCRRYR
jgi:hypothetical protein